MEPSMGTLEHAGEHQRNVRRRFRSPRRDAEGAEQLRLLTPQSTATSVRPVSSPKNISTGGSFFIVTEKRACEVPTCEGGAPVFLEADRCWREHHATGKAHSKPPWRLCSAAEDNREHPWCMQWLDTMELPPLGELLRREGSNGVTLDSSSRSEEKRAMIERRFSRGEQGGEKGNLKESESEKRP